MSRFATTRWSIVRAANDLGGSTEARRALRELFEQYWPPLYVYARRQGFGEEDAEDAVQGFFVEVMENNGIRNADPKRGRFRSYLRQAFRHHLGHVRERAAAKKRGGDRAIESLDTRLAEQRVGLEIADQETPERAFERAWAQTLVDRARDRLRSEWFERGKEELYQRLSGALAHGVTAPYAQIAAETGRSEVSIKVTVHRLRARFRELLLAEVKQTLPEGEDPESELRELLSALAGH